MCGQRTDAYLSSVSKRIVYFVWTRFSGQYLESECLSYALPGRGVEGVISVRDIHSRRLFRMEQRNGVLRLA